MFCYALSTFSPSRINRCVQLTTSEFFTNLDRFFLNYLDKIIIFRMQFSISPQEYTLFHGPYKVQFFLCVLAVNDIVPWLISIVLLNLHLALHTVWTVSLVLFSFKFLLNWTMSLLVHRRNRCTGVSRLFLRGRL